MRGAEFEGAVGRVLFCGPGMPVRGAQRRTGPSIVCALLLTAALGERVVVAAEHSGQVAVGRVPVPGAIVTATRGDRRVATVTDAQGLYRFLDLEEGLWTIQVSMAGFAPAQQDVAVSPAPVAATFALTLLSFEQLTQSLATVRAESARPDTLAPALAAAPVATPPSAIDSAIAEPGNPTDADAADGLLINGSVNNGAASPFAQAAAFGNNRSNRRSLYNGGFGVVFGSSAFDARPYSFTQRPAPKASYNDVQMLGTFGGPLRIPGLTRTGPNSFVGYQMTIDHQASTGTGLVPSLRERAGDFSASAGASGQPLSIIDPITGQPFSGARIPVERLNPSALALLAYYPLPNVAPGERYNYQAPLLAATRQDNLQSRFIQALNTRNSLTGTFAFQRTDTESTSLVGFTDRSVVGSIDGTAVWSRRLSAFFTTRLRYQFTRATTNVTPHFANRTNVSSLAGIAGNDQSPANWGPPALAFSSGLLGLSDAEYAETAAITHGVLGEAFWNRARHNISAGGGLRRTSIDAAGQQNGRGGFTLTGALSGADFADFLLGLPTAEAITVGNPDKQLRGLSYEAYVTDDWRVTPALTLNLGVRWEFDSPMTEADSRMSNLDVTSDFSAVSIVTPDDPVGSLTGRRFSPALLSADWRGLQPRVGVAWRPVAGSSLVVRGGYGLYRNTATYQSLALLMAQQPPFSNALSVETSAGAPLTLANGFLTTNRGAPVTFAVDPDFRIGSAQNWQLTMQRDLPASLTVMAGYLGADGLNLMQEFLPNTYPSGAANPCPGCPIGFAYLTSDGSSSRHAAQFQLRRRLRNGLATSVQYTLSKSTDDAGAFTGASLSGAAIAQDWQDLEAERGPSNFDQRHLVNAQFQYTTGVGARGGGLLTGIKGSLFKGWTATSTIIAGSGLPFTPIYLASVRGTGVTGTLRASTTGAPLEDEPDGRYLNPAAFATPPPGQWGNAGRNSATGPAQFSMSAGVSRTFAIGDRATLDWRVDATNVLNRVTFSTVETVVDSPQFGAPTRANPMRKLQSTLRLRF